MSKPKISSFFVLRALRAKCVRTAASLIANRDRKIRARKIAVNSWKRLFLENRKLFLFFLWGKILPPKIPPEFSGGER